MAPQGYPHWSEDTTRHPMEILVGTIGHEGEYCQGNLAPWLAEREYAPPDGVLHEYQCRCSRRNDFLIHPTSDCTAHGGEYIIGGAEGVLFGSPTYALATEALAVAVAENRAGINEAVGFHTHVGFQKRDGSAMTATQKRRLVKNYMALEDQIRVLASGAFRTVRSQAPLMKNDYTLTRCISFDGRGRPPADFWKTRPRDMTFDLPGRSTLNFHTGKGTVEFRVWNAVRSQWRMVVAGAVSVAMTEAACQRREVKGPDEMDLVEHLDGLLPVDVLPLIDRQRTFWTQIGGRHA